MESIYHQVIIDADEKVVLKAITSTEGVAGWWIAECKIGEKTGEENVFYYNNEPSLKMRINRLEETGVEWECVKGPEEWMGTKIVFSFTVYNSYIKLDFRHTGWKEQSEFFGTCSYHWARHMRMLRALCETGENQVKPEVEKNEIQRVAGIR